MKEGQKCWTWSTKNPDPKIGRNELWGEFWVKDIWLEQTTFESANKERYYKTKEDALTAMLQRIEELKLCY